MLLKFTMFALFTLAQNASSLADFRTGRIEPESYAEMRTIRAGGIFEGRAGARVEMNYQDGQGAPVSITLRVPGMEPAVLPMVRVAPTDCGDHYVAVLGDSASFVTTRLELTDYSVLRCRIYKAYPWEVKVMHSDDEGKLSEWLLEGSPQQVLRTR
jgi:hypothetical protein